MFSHYEECPRCVSRGKDSRGDNLGVYTSGHGHCWACGYHRFPKLPVFNLKVPNDHKSLLPADFSREVPAEAIKWLLQWQLPFSHWKESVGYSEEHQRLVFRVGEPLQFSIGRYIRTKPEDHHGSTLPEFPESNRSNSWGNLPENHALRRGRRTPVQRTAAPRKWWVWGDSHKHAEIVGEQGEAIVLVEDILSAHVVAAAGYTCIPLFGTQVHTPHMYYLANDTRPIVLWLDKDQQGNVQKQALRLQGILGRAIKVVVTDNDPKAIKINDIKGILT